MIEHEEQNTTSIIRTRHYTEPSWIYYIMDAVEIVNNSKNHKGTCEIYEEVAEKNNKKKECVERAIRHAITKCDINSEAWKKHVGIKETKNSAFIYALALNVTEE